MPNELKKYIVLKVDFRDLEHWLNQISEMYPTYHLYSVVPEHSYNGALAAIILEVDTMIPEVVIKDAE